jgi:hypothetical protein
VCGLVLANLLSLLFNPPGIQGRYSREQNRDQAGPATLGLEEGHLELDTPDFDLRLVKASQTVAALQPKRARGFVYTPADRIEARARDG